VKSAPRITRVNELLKREIADLIERHIEHKNDCLISVTEVSTTPDLRQAKVRISILGDDDAKKGLMKVLQKKRSFIQQLVARNITLKYTPVIEFHYDSRIELGDKVLAMLNEIDSEQSE